MCQNFYYLHHPEFTDTWLQSIIFSRSTFVLQYVCALGHHFRKNVLYCSHWPIKNMRRADVVGIFRLPIKISSSCSNHISRWHCATYLHLHFLRKTLQKSVDMHHTPSTVRIQYMYVSFLFACLGLGIASLLIALLVRVLFTFVCVLCAGFNLKEKVFIALAWMPKATVQVC